MILRGPGHARADTSRAHCWETVGIHSYLSSGRSHRCTSRDHIPLISLQTIIILYVYALHKGMVAGRRGNYARLVVPNKFVRCTLQPLTLRNLLRVVVDMTVATAHPQISTDDNLPAAFPNPP